MQITVNETVKVNILLVDDKKENLYSLEALLKRDSNNINYIHALSGKEALKIALKVKPALIMLDVQMPELDGYEVAAILKQNFATQNIPIIFVTALHEDMGHMLKGYRTGAVDFLFKPLNAVVTRAKVDAFINMYVHQKELENLVMLVNNSLDLMCILNNKLEVLVVNPVWQNLLGYLPEDLHNLKITGFIHSTDQQENFINTLQQKSREKQKSLFIELRMKDAKGGSLWIEWNFIYKDKKWYGSGRDITSRKVAEEKLAKAYNELEQRVKNRTADLQSKNLELQDEIEKRIIAEENLRQNNQRLIKINKDLDHFVYTASHDLKLPLNNLNALISTLKEELKDVDSESVNSIFSMLLVSVKRLRETIEDLVQMIKIQKEEGEQVYEISCEEVISEIESSIKDIISESGAKIIKDFPRGDKVRLTRPALKSVLYNLISNAIKYRSPERVPEIFISLAEVDSFKRLMVKDNGLGINDEDRKKLFKLFQRLHDHVDGSGMGLFIVKNTLEKYNASIQVKSRPGIGSEFIIHLPA